MINNNKNCLQLHIFFWFIISQKKKLVNLCVCVCGCVKTPVLYLFEFKVLLKKMLIHRLIPSDILYEPVKCGVLEEPSDNMLQRHIISHCSPKSIRPIL